MNRKMSKRQRDIKSKLMAAICMLLVSSIMMVSTTYAWFTLSTAPEVTGINTAVGANGNLEMALMPLDGNIESIDSGDGDGELPIKDRNVTWGNLVDLSDNSVYGMQNITLYPSALNLDADGKTILDVPLKTPEYGADGRVKELKANTATAVYDEGFDANNTGKGVRAIGVSSGISQRELDYKNALSAGNIAAASARTKARQALEANGTALASIAINQGLNDNATFDAGDIAALTAMVSGLEDAIAQIDNAYMQYILAYAASGLNTEESVYSGVKLLVESSENLAAVETGLTTAGLTLNSLPVATGINAYKTTKAAVEAARAALPSGKTEYAWSEIEAVVKALANPSNMTVNTYSVSEVRDNPQLLMDAYFAAGRLDIAVSTGAGVFADIADQSGKYEAKITITGVSYAGLNINNAPAYMNITTTQNPPHLNKAGTDVSGHTPTNAGSTENKTLTEMYGYIIDMAFRTNAANSDLLLQVDAVDRIYSDQTGAETMGHGASMTFSNISDDMIVTAEGQDRYGKVKNLMNAIRIVFFDPTNANTIVAKAKLDAANATQDTDGLTAKMYLYTDSAGEMQYKEATYDPSKTGIVYYTKGTEMVYEEVNDVTAENFEQKKANLFTKEGEAYTPATTFTEGATYYSSNTKDKYTETDDPANAGVQLYVYELTGAGETKAQDNVLMAMPQNQPVALSALVYLDGNMVENKDVAYSIETTMSGTMNLQFSSSATLVPMDYRDLHQVPITPAPDAGGEGAENP